MNVLRSLKHRRFALLWSGQTISRLGDSYCRIALAGWATDLIGGTAAMLLALIGLSHPAIRNLD